MGVHDRRSLLRPMSSGQIIDTATRAYQRLGKSILQLTAAPMLLCFCVLLFFFLFLGPAFFRTSNPESIGTQLVEAAIIGLVALFVALPLFLIGLGYAQALITRLVGDFVLGNKPDENSALAAASRGLKTTVRVLMRTFVAAFLGLAVGLGFLALGALLTERSSPDNPLPALLGVLSIVAFCIAPFLFVIVLLRCALAPSIVVLEEASAKQAVERSQRLLSATRGQVGGSGTLIGLASLCLLVFLMLWGATTAGFGMLGLFEHVRNFFGDGPLGMILQGLVAMLPAYFALWVTMPIWSTACTILYFDRRIRLEGYDITVLEQDVRRASRKSRFQF